MIALADQVAFMRSELENREVSADNKIAMGRISRNESDQLIALTRAVLETLESREGLLEGPMVTLEHHREMVFELEERLNGAAKIWPVIEQVRQCAKEHALGNVHCESISNLLEEALK